MASLSAIARRHLAAAIEEAGETGYRPDEVADAALSEAIRVMREPDPSMTLPAS